MVAESFCLGQQVGIRQARAAMPVGVADYGGAADLQGVGGKLHPAAVMASLKIDTNDARAVNCGHVVSSPISPVSWLSRADKGENASPEGAWPQRVAMPR